MNSPLAEAVLETERLVLRPWLSGDAADVQTACNDPLTRRWIPLPDPYDEAVAHSWVDDLSHRARLAGTGAMFAVVERAGGRLIGGFGMHGVDDRDRCGEIGYWVAPWARGLGYAPEATRRLARYGFEELGLGRVELLIEPANGASHRVAAKSGFTSEGVRTAAGRHGERRVDLAGWRLLPDDPFPAARLLPDAAERSDGMVGIRAAMAADAEGVFEERTDPEYARWSTPGGPSQPPGSVAEVRGRLEEADWQWLSGQSARFAVLDQDSGAYAGSIGIHPYLHEWGTAVVSYAMHPAFRGRGMLRQALPMVARWAFSEAGLARLEAGVATGNRASMRVAEAAGFRREGLMRSLQPLAGGRTDQVLFSLLPGDLP